MSNRNLQLLAPFFRAPAAAPPTPAVVYYMSDRADKLYTFDPTSPPAVSPVTISGFDQTLSNEMVALFQTEAGIFTIGGDLIRSLDLATSTVTDFGRSLTSCEGAVIQTIGRTRYLFQSQWLGPTVRIAPLSSAGMPQLGSAVDRQFTGISG